MSGVTGVEFEGEKNERQLEIIVLYKITLDILSRKGGSAGDKVGYKAALEVGFQSGRRWRHLLCYATAAIR
jgi:hypothetical protein